MKGLVIHADRSIHYIEQPAPVLKPGHVILDVAACGICGSDMHVCRGADSSWRFPILFGHEFAGTIAAVSDDVTAYQPGDVVTVETMTYCGTCDMCRQQRYNLCPNAELYGAELPGGFAKQVAVDARYLVRVPAGVSAVQAAIAEPLATVIHGFNRLKQTSFENVAIFGAGAIGLLAVSIALTKSKNVAVVDVSQSRLDIAKTMGAAAVINSKTQDVEQAIMDMSGGRKMDLCIDCAGLTVTRNQAFEVISPGAELLCIALGDDFTPTNYRQIVTKELAVYGTQCHYVSDFEEAVQALKAGHIPFDKIVTTYPLDEGLTVFEAIRSGNDKGIKVMLLP